GRGVGEGAGVRRMVGGALGGEGHAVLEAASAEQALRLAAAHPGPIDLLVADVGLPGVSGRELAGRLAAQRPGLRVLYCSWHDRQALQARGALAPTAALLEKAFSIDALLARVREALGGQASGSTPSG